MSARPGPTGGDRNPLTWRDLRERPVTMLKGVTDKKAAALAEFGVETVLDLLTTYPRRHIDATQQVDLADLAVGDEAVVLATVRRTSGRRTRNGRALVELSVHDGTAGMRVVFFNQAWRERQLRPGSEGLFFGKLDTYQGTRQMTNPAVDLLVDVEGAGDGPKHTLQVIPVYPASAKFGLTSSEIRRWAAEALRRAGPLVDPLPEQFRRRLSLEDRSIALRGVHLPESMSDVWPARRRLIFDEFFRLQLALVLRRRALERDARAIRHRVSPDEVPADGVPADGVAADEVAADEVAADEVAAGGGPPGHQPTLVEQFVWALPFQLTAAQRRALRELFADLAGPVPMHRLLQGDVGSGKTVVAVATMLAGVQGGHQGALMVPTEVLAEQHFLAVRSLVEGLWVPDVGRLEGRRPITVALLTSRTPAGERTRLHEGLRAGDVDLLVGTHALLTEQVSFRSLGVVVIDEQHRFGVEQRAALRQKGRPGGDATYNGESPSGDGWTGDGPTGGGDPDLLVMTATPIPRTAAMVVFGDLGMTVLDELPPGRTPITTVWARTGLEEAEAWERIRSEVAMGRRAYVVCPLVEGSDRVQARSAVEEFERLASEVLVGLRLGLLHGQMGAQEKEAAMADFRSGGLDVLVATTVIEVGVDVPEATVMVVEDAARFGMAQLHQLRGRVGRGPQQSWCYLLGEATAPDAAERLQAVVDTTDGFELAEVDLRLRGEGAILGARQKGKSDLKLASLQRDRELLDQARMVAEEITAGDPLLVDHGLLEDEVRLFLDEEEAEFLFKS